MAGWLSANQVSLALDRALRRRGAARRAPADGGLVHRRLVQRAHDLRDMNRLEFSMLDVRFRFISCSPSWS